MIKMSIMDVRKILGQNIKRYRLFKGIKAETFAKKIGLSPEHLSKLENANKTAKNIGLNYLIKIAKELDIPIEQLFMANSEIAMIPKENLKSLYRLAGISKKKIESR